MTTINISLPEELRAKVMARAVDAGHPSIELYIEALLRADAGDADRGSSHALRTQDDLEALLLQRVDAPDAGEMTSADFDAIRGRVLTVAKKGSPRA